jgi:DNA-binding transcriptional LysR family regulator
MSLATRDLDYFLEIARCGQLTQAATNLDVTAAALSKAIRRLEEEMGLRLFERSGQGMSLTPFGASFRERALRIKTEHDEALVHAGDVRAGRAGLLRIGATMAVLETVISPALASLQPRRPGLHAQLTVSASDDVLERTRQGSVDASVVPIYDALPHGLQHEALGSDELVPVLREGHPFLRDRRLDLQRLAAAGHWILPRAPSAARMRFDAVFHAVGIQPPHGTIEVDFNTSWSLSLVARTELLALVPRSALRTRVAGVRELEFEALHLPRTIALFSRSGASRSPLLAEFVQGLKKARGGAGMQRR